MSTETASRKTEDRDREISTTESIMMRLREEEHEYMKKFEKKIYKEEKGGTLDGSVLEQIRTDIDKLEAALSSVGKEQDYIIE